MGSKGLGATRGTSTAAALCDPVEGSVASASPPQAVTDKGRSSTSAKFAAKSRMSFTMRPNHFTCGKASRRQQLSLARAKHDQHSESVSPQVADTHRLRPRAVTPHLSANMREVDMEVSHGNQCANCQPGPLVLSPSPSTLFLIKASRERVGAKLLPAGMRPA